jgi:hypothetical protein
MTEDELQQRIKELVIARLRSTPPHLGIIIGSGEQKKYTPEELIGQIEQGTTLGKEYLELEIDFLRALKDGVLYEQNTV